MTRSRFRSLCLGSPASLTTVAIAVGLLVQASAQSQPSHRGFTFTAGTCELGPQFCAIAAPREWTADEIALVSGALDEIAASDLGRRITDRALSNGFRTLRRFARAARRDGERGYQADAATVATTHHDDQGAVKTIDLTDRFFERGALRDQFSGPPGYLLTTEILAHELVHAFDMDQRYSATETFRRGIRLGMPAALQAEVDAANEARRPLVDASRHADDWYASRSFAIVRLRGRLPSLHALEGYREAFAEIGAHLVLDANARTQFEPRVIRYFTLSVSGDMP
jgi:hypothetical protein